MSRVCEAEAAARCGRVEDFYEVACDVVVCSGGVAWPQGVATCFASVKWLCEVAVSLGWLKAHCASAGGPENCSAGGGGG